MATTPTTFSASFSDLEEERRASSRSQKDYEREKGRGRNKRSRNRLVDLWAGASRMWREVSRRLALGVPPPRRRSTRLMMRLDTLFTPAVSEASTLLLRWGPANPNRNFAWFVVGSLCLIGDVAMFCFLTDRSRGFIRYYSVKDCHFEVSFRLGSKCLYLIRTQNILHWSLIFDFRDFLSCTEKRNFMQQMQWNITGSWKEIGVWRTNCILFFWLFSWFEKKNLIFPRDQNTMSFAIANPVTCVSSRFWGN